MIQAYATEHNAIRGFRRNFAHLANLSNDTIRMDVLGSENGKHTISLDMVAELEADKLGETKTQRIEGVPALRRTVGNAKGATARVRAFFAQLPEGIARRCRLRLCDGPDAVSGVGAGLIFSGCHVPQNAA